MGDLEYGFRLASHPEEVETFLVATCYKNWDQLRFDGPHDSKADFTFYNFDMDYNITENRLKHSFLTWILELSKFS